LRTYFSSFDSFQACRNQFERDNLPFLQLVQALLSFEFFCFFSFALAAESIARFGLQRLSFLSVGPIIGVSYGAPSGQLLGGDAVILVVAFRIALDDQVPSLYELRNAGLTDSAEHHGHLTRR